MVADNVTKSTMVEGKLSKSELTEALCKQCNKDDGVAILTKSDKDAIDVLTDSFVAVSRADSFLCCFMLILIT